MVRYFRYRSADGGEARGLDLNSVSKGTKSDILACQQFIHLSSLANPQDSKE